MNSVALSWTRPPVPLVPVAFSKSSSLVKPVPSRAIEYTTPRVEAPPLAFVPPPLVDP
jgi:hypothetical protein